VGALLNCSLLALLSDKGGVKGEAPAASLVLTSEGLRECLDKLPDEAEERRVELVVPPMAERFARALEVFSRAKAAKERRLRREIEPITDPVKLVVLVLIAEVLFGGVATAAGVAELGRQEAEGSVEEE
jgi:hypothetical protein